MSDKVLPGSPEDWLRHAKSDLVYAKYNESGVLLNQKCFHCQQCVEKSLKAVFIKHNIPIQKTHDIHKLISSLPEGLELPEYLIESSMLSNYAVELRYPGDLEEITDEEYYSAICLAEKVFGWASELIEPSNK